jgi:hypothetical protein
MGWNVHPSPPVEWCRSAVQSHFGLMADGQRGLGCVGQRVGQSFFVPFDVLEYNHAHWRACKITTTRNQSCKHYSRSGPPDHPADGQQARIGWGNFRGGTPGVPKWKSAYWRTKSGSTLKSASTCRTCSASDTRICRTSCLLDSGVIPYRRSLSQSPALRD